MEMHHHGLLLQAVTTVALLLLVLHLQIQMMKQITCLNMLQHLARDPS